MRIVTWNLNLGATSPTEGWDHKARWLDATQAELRLLTEVHPSWDPRGRRQALSPRRSRLAERGTWAAIETPLSLTELPATEDDLRHSGEEGLALARVELENVPILVACSVLPWESVTHELWDGLPGGYYDKFRFVLGQHVMRIVRERRPGEPLIWGGDFNQPLVPPFTGGSGDAATVLSAAFDYFGLTTLTKGMTHRKDTMYTIDQIAVSQHFLTMRVEAHRPKRPDGTVMSDHDAYTADVRLIEP